MSNNRLSDLIDAIVDGDTLQIQSTFNDEMTSRLSDVLDVYRAEVASSLFKKPEEE